MSKLTITSEVTANTANNTLDVKDHGQAISVPREPETTKLVWTLTGAGSNASFNAIDLGDPATSGFSWVDPTTAPAGFQTPTLGANENQVIMDDTNDGNGTAGGPYVYMLRATVGGVPCATTASMSPTGTSNNPQIKNN